MEKSLYMKEEKLAQAFRMFDVDGNGKISREELKQVLGSTDYCFFNFNIIQNEIINTCFFLFL